MKMASGKHELPFSDEPQFKKAKVMESELSQSVAESKPRVVLNPADCDIDFNVEGNGLQGSALYEEGFAYCWSGARANIGIAGGKYCFSCKIMSAQPVDMEDTPIDQQHVCRVGISRGDDPVRNLGETLHSFGFGGTGKFSNSGSFIDYGEKFGVGDTIVCAVDLENKLMASVSFSKNGKWLGVAQHFDAGSTDLSVVGSPLEKPMWSSAFFPHVLLKNVVVQLQFSIEDGLIPLEGYKPWAAASLDGKTVLGPTFSNEEDCEVIMMVGLPASGKTTWAEKWVKEHPEKRYVLLGTNLALEQMKVPGLLRKHNYGERFDRLMDHATKIFNVLLSRASKRHRNYIIDQTNVYKNARKRKLKPFANYIKIAAVVFPRPEELKVRAHKRFKEMGKEVPAEAINEMLANYTLPMSKDMPRTDEYFDKVWFVELSQAESQRCLDEMKQEMNVKPSVPPYSRGKSLMSSSSSSVQNYQKAPVESYSCTSVQNQGTRDQFLISVSSRPLSGDPFESYNSSHSSYGSGHNSTYTSRYDYGTMNYPQGIMQPARGDVTDAYRRYETEDAPQGRMQATHGSSGDVYRGYGVEDAHGRTGDESRQFQRGVNVCLNRCGISEPYPGASSLSHITYDGGYPIRPGGMPCDQSGVTPHGYQSVPPVAFGYYGNQIPRPPFWNLSNDVASHPPAPSPPYLNFPTDVHHRGVYSQPPRGY